MGNGRRKDFIINYPRIEQVRDWIQLAHFRLIDETAGDEYHHFLVQEY